MFFNLPIELQLKILREYMSIEDKYNLLKIKSFNNLLMEKYSWLYSLKIPLKKLHLHCKHLLDNVRPGYYVRYPRNALFRVSINYSAAKVTISEYKNKNIIYKQPLRKKIKYSAEKVGSFLNRFYTLAQNVNLNHVYETWDRYIITFDPDKNILGINDTKEFEMLRCHLNTFCTVDRSVYLLKERNRLIIFFARKPNIHIDMCCYLHEARNMGIEELRYKNPFVGSLVKLVKAYSFHNNFKSVSKLDLQYKPKLHEIQLTFTGKYLNLNATNNQTLNLFHLNNE